MKGKASSEEQKDLKTHDVWYNEYQEKKRQQYDIFMKRMEVDPIGMLFGRTWANLVEGAEAKSAGSSAAESCGTQVKQSDFKTSDTPLQSKTPRGNQVSEARTGSGITELETQCDVYDIDPITNRKVSRRSHTAQSLPEPMPKSTSMSDSKEAIDIPVKPFASVDGERKSSFRPIKVPNSGTANLRSQSIPSKDSSQLWLAKEGFSNPSQKKFKAQSVEPKSYSDSRGSTPKIESALDRHLQMKGSTTSQERSCSLEYRPQDKKTEDIDLLRSSDVRASAGLRGRSAKEPDAERLERHRKLEQNYDSCSVVRERQLQQEIENKPGKQDCWKNKPLEQSEGNNNARVPQDTTAETGSERSTMAAIDANWTNQVSEVQPVPNSVPGKSMRRINESEKVNKIKAQIVPLKARLDAIKADYDMLRQRWLDEKRRHEEKVAKKIKNMHDAEVNAQKVAMENIEMGGVRRKIEPASTLASGAQQQGINGQVSQRQLRSLLPGEGDMASNVHEFANRGRWYKKKAPHADGDMEAKLAELAIDRSLIQEIRSIYEQTYGTIDTQHRQSTNEQDAQRTSNVADCQESLPSSVPFAVDSEASGSNADTKSLSSTHSLSAQSTNPSALRIDNIQAYSFPAAMQGLSNQLQKIQDLLQHHGDGLDKSGNALVSTDTNDPSQRTPPIVMYCILAYDPTRQDVVLSRTTSLAPTNKEPQLSLVEALAAVDKPQKFLADLVRVHNNGYVAVFATYDTVVLEKVAAFEEARDAKTKSVRKESTTDHPEQEGIRSKPEGQAKQATSVDTATSAPETSSKEEANAPPSPSGKVYRKEAVFSGSPRKDWQDAENVRSARRLKHATKRSRKGKHVLLTGTITAGCCYAVGVVSQMMQ